MKKDFLLLVIIIGATACTTIVDFDIPLNQPKVVVNSLFSPDSVWQLQITRSKNILDVAPGSFFQPVGDAVVTILDQNGQLVETITGYSGKNFGYSYKGKTKPLPTQSYSIQVAVKNELLLQAVNKVPTHVPITSVVIDSSRFIAEGEAIEMKISFKDPGDEKNFYTVKFIEDAFYVVGSIVNNVFKGDTIRYTQEVYFEVVTQSLTDEVNGLEKIMNDKLFNGKEYTFHLRLHNRYYGGLHIPRHSRVILLSISEEYYKYLTTKTLQEYTSGDPFAQPVQVFTNVENGLGIFAGYSTSVVELK